MAAAALLCQPSHNESFSLVIMESWLCGRPVLVSSQCAVTKDFAKRSNGGLYFKDYFEFEGCVQYILQNPEAAAELGANGGAFVRENFEWDVIVEKYRTFFQKLMGACESHWVTRGTGWRSAAAAKPMPEKLQNIWRTGMKWRY